MDDITTSQTWKIIHIKINIQMKLAKIPNQVSQRKWSHSVMGVIHNLLDISNDVWIRVELTFCIFNSTFDVATPQNSQ